MECMHSYSGILDLRTYLDDLDILHTHTHTLTHTPTNTHTHTHTHIKFRGTRFWQ